VTLLRNYGIGMGEIVELLDYSGNTANRRKGKCKMNLKQSQVSVVEVIPLRC